MANAFHPPARRMRRKAATPGAAAFGHGKGITMLGHVGCCVAGAAEALPPASAVPGGLGPETRRRGEPRQMCR